MANWTYDVETLPNFFCAVFKNNDEYKIFEISNWKDDYNELISFLKTVNSLRGYNNVNFDSQIISLLQSKKMNAKEIHECTVKIIEEEQILVPHYRRTIFNVDIYKILHLDNKNRMTSLKWCEFMIDWPNLEDMPYHGHINSREEADATISYCINDVDATDKLFKLYEKELQLRISLTNKYRINFINASNSRIGSELMLDLYCKAVQADKKQIKNKQTIRTNVRVKDVVFDYITFKSIELNGLLNWFKDKIIEPTEDFKKSFIYKDFQFDYGKGGIHGSLSTEIVDTDDDWIIIDADVASLYPSIATVNNLYPEHLGEDFSRVYKEDIVDVRLREKAKGKEGDYVIVAGYKEAANSVYGKSNEETSWLRDFKYTLSTTINGQLMLTMLAEDLMDIPDLKLIQINTDGLTCKLKKQYETQYYNICKKWESITKLQLEYAYYSKMIIRDVNNYIAIYTNGKTKCKGSFEFENLPLHKNKSSLITRIAIYNYFLYNKHVEETIINHDNIFDFCIGVRAKQDSKFVAISNINTRYNLPKTIRYIISKKGMVFKKLYSNGGQEYLNAHPQKGRSYYSTLLNKINNKDPKKYDINYQYYITQANAEIEKFQQKPNLFNF
jgi:hypothetical protein